MIYWKSSKQHTVIDLICEVEYIITSNAAKETIWLHNFLDELAVAPSLECSVPLYCDNIRAIAQAKEPKAHQPTKHILCHFYHMWEIVERGDINLQKINKKENMADPFTKALKIKEFDDFKWKMSIRYYFDWL